MQQKPPRAKTRPMQGERLRDLRKAAGLSQADLAKAIGERQEAVSFWERSAKPPRSDVLAKMATVLGVTVEDILGIRTAEAKQQPLGSAPGPTSEIQKVFEQVRKLPRRQQRKVLEMVTAFVDMYTRKAS